MKRQILLTCLLILSLAACEEPISKVAESTKIYDPNVETAQDVEMIYSSEGETKVKVTAPLLVTHNDKKEPTTEFSEGLKVVFYNSNLQERSRLTADYAIRYEKKSKVFIRDNVRIISPQNELIEAEELVWDDKKQEMTSDKKVTITTDDEKITCYRFWSNQDFSVYEMDSVSGIVKVNPTEIEQK